MYGICFIFCLLNAPHISMYVLYGLREYTHAMLCYELAQKRILVQYSFLVLTTVLKISQSAVITNHTNPRKSKSSFENLA